MGAVHYRGTAEMIFSTEMMDLYHLILEESDPDVRKTMLIDLAEMYLLEVDHSDETIPEYIFNLVNGLQRDRIIYDASSLELARELMRKLPIFEAALEDMPSEEEEETDLVPPSLNDSEKPKPN